MRSRGSFSTLKALGAAFSFWPKAMTAAWLVLGLLSLGLLSQTYAPLHWPYSPWARFVPALAVLVFGLMAQGALLRKALFERYAKAEGLGFGGLQLARPELRLIVAAILIVLFMVLIMAVMFAVLAVGLNAAGLTPMGASSLDKLHEIIMSPKGTIEQGFRIALGLMALFMVILGLRFSFYRVATVAQHQVVSLNALGLSSGQLLKIVLGMILLVILPQIVIILAMSGFDFKHLGTANCIEICSTLKAHDLAQGIKLTHSPLSPISALVLIWVILPLWTGFITSAYRQVVALRTKA